MKKIFEPMKLFISMLLLGWSFCFVACSDDDKNTPELPDEITTETMFGDYTGKMSAVTQSPEKVAPKNDETDEGVAITAHVNNDTIHFEKFPIKDIVMSIVKDETTADKIVEAVGDVNYKIGYKPTLTTAKDSIKLALAPNPLKLSITAPSNTQEGPQTLFIEVKVEAGHDAGYAIESANLKFNFTATEVLLGEDQNPLPDFTPITLNFDMNQNKIQPTRF